MIKTRYCIGIVVLSFITTVAVISKDETLKEKKLDGTITKVEEGLGVVKKREGNKTYDIYKNMDKLTVETKKGKYEVYHDVKGNFKEGEEIKVVINNDRTINIVE